MMKVLIFLSCFSLFAFCRAEPLHGPNVNPANLPVLIEWEKFTGRKADIIGDNFSAHTWSVFHEALEFRESGQTSAIAEQLRRWADAFDGDRIIRDAESAAPYYGKPRGALSDYIIEMSVPIFPGLLLNREGEMVDASTVSDRWEMGEKSNRHHKAAREAFRSLAKALVSNGMGGARIRLGWEFSRRLVPVGN